MRTKPQTQPPSRSPSKVEALSVSQAAQLVGVSEQALRKRIRKGTLPAHKLRRGNQIVTVLSPRDLAQAYPEAAERLGALGADTQPVGQPPGTGPSDEGQGGEVNSRLRENLATAVAARLAADSRCEAAEVRAERAEDKLERALVQRGDEIAKTRKDAEQQAMQMAMEIARAQIQALPEANQDPQPSQRRWLGGVALAATLIAIAAVVWGFQGWGSLGDSRDQSDALGTQVVDLQEHAAGLLARAVEAETAQLKVKEETLQAQLAVADERLEWDAQERGLREELSEEREVAQRLGVDLALAHGLRRARLNVALVALLLQHIYQR